MDSLTLTEAVRCHAGGESAPSPEKTVSLREVLQERLTDPRDPRGVRHSLPSLVSVLVAGIASGLPGPLAIAQAARGWDQKVLVAHGCHRSPATGLLEPPSASTLTRLPALVSADELEAALTSVAGTRGAGSAGRRGGGGSRRGPLLPPTRPR